MASPFAENPWQQNFYESGSYDIPVDPIGAATALGGPPRGAKLGPQTGGASKEIKFQMPDGSTKTVSVTAADLTGNANKDLQDALTQGGTPMDDQGNPMTNALPKNADGSPNLTGIHGGTLWNTSRGPQTLAQAFGFDPSGAIGGATQDYLRAGWKPGDPPLTNPPPLGRQAAQAVPGYQQPTGPSGLIQNLDNPNLPLIPGIDLGDAPQISTSLPGDVQQGVSDITRQVSDAIGGQYTSALQNMPQMKAAQTDLSGVPQTRMTAFGAVPQMNAAQIGTSPELAKMLSGTLGFDPGMLAKMKANATDSTAAMGGSELAQAMRSAEQAGVGGSGVSSAVAQDIARQTGAANTQSQNAIDIQNAMEALKNFQTGVGYQQRNAQTNAGFQQGANLENTQNQMTAAGDNFQMANQMALANAQKLFDAIQQNTQNQQSANMENAQAGQKLNEEGAATKAGFDASQGNLLNSANLSQAQNALFSNAQNAINQKLNQAQLDRQQAITNLNAQQNQWQVANTLGMGMNPVTGFNPQQTFSPIGGTLQNIGGGLMGQANRQQNVLGSS